MGRDEAGWLLLYTYVEGSSLFDSFPAEDLIELSASLQRRFRTSLLSRPTLRRRFAPLGLVWQDSGP